jgi:hypothetical protein
MGPSYGTLTAVHAERRKSRIATAELICRSIGWGVRVTAETGIYEGETVRREDSDLPPPERGRVGEGVAGGKNRESADPHPNSERGREPLGEVAPLLIALDAAQRWA